MAREREEATFLKMAKQAFDKQAAAGRHAYVEGPSSGLHWKTREIQKLRGDFCGLDQRRLGA
eukprot:4599926-Pyramimonas_sp.AAC.1